MTEGLARLHDGMRPFYLVFSLCANFGALLGAFIFLEMSLSDRLNGHVIQYGNAVLYN